MKCWGSPSNPQPPDSWKWIGTIEERMTGLGRSCSPVANLGTLPSAIDGRPSRDNWFGTPSPSSGSANHTLAKLYCESSLAIRPVRLASRFHEHTSVIMGHGNRDWSQM
mmetsp:Transcript_39910/g.62251  ORF Transcript_39910/g.62251 Transcript_39910/m.62251 type:complete len:109 (+) Transcript_39910:134-460(+)